MMAATHLIALGYAQGVGVLIAVLVVAVVATAALEAATPAPKRRSTRLGMPRRISASLDELPGMDSVRVAYDSRLADTLERKPSVLLRPGPNGPEPLMPVVAVQGAEPGPPPEALPPTVAVPRPEPRVIAARRDEYREDLLASAIDGLPVPEPVAVPMAVVEDSVFAFRAELPDSDLVEVGAPGSERELAGVLFAAYVVSGGVERNRVTGWVAAVDEPPGLAGIDPDERLRGKPGKVRKLLECSDEGRNWVTLDERTDIERGLTRKAPVDPVLKGLVWWWYVATGSADRLPAEGVADLRTALESLAECIEDNPWSGVVDELSATCRIAGEARVGLRLGLVSARSMDSEGLDEDGPDQKAELLAV